MSDLRSGAEQRSTEASSGGGEPTGAILTQF